MGIRAKWALACAVPLILAGASYLHFARRRSPPGSAHAVSRQEEAPQADRLKRVGEDGLHVPEETAEKMGLRTELVSAVESPISLPSLQGVLALDNDRLSHVHARFGGEVVEMGHSTDALDHPLRVGDQVRRGDLLAVIWSTALGEKKSALADALAKLRAEEYLRDQLKNLFEKGSGAGRNYRDAEKDVQVRRVEVASLERALHTWRVTEEEIDHIRAEVARLADSRQPNPESVDWARVELRAPIDGVVLEKNLVIGDIVDTTTDLFKIGDLSQLTVWAHVYEEDLPLVESLPRPVPWTLTLPSQPGKEFPGTLDKIAAIIDPTQHTALVMGQVENSTGQLKIGQFVSAAVQAPPPDNELELPAVAVVENGPESVVFVQPDPGHHRFIRRAVSVVRRFRETIYVRRQDSGLQPGDRVVTAGALMLQNAMVQMPAGMEEAARVSARGGQSKTKASRRE